MTLTVSKILCLEIYCSLSFVLQLNFWSFAIIFVLSAVALNYWIRFRYLNDYTQLKEPPLLKPDANELHPDVNTGERIADSINVLDSRTFQTLRRLSITISMTSCKLFESLDLFVSSRFGMSHATNVLI
jgi:hypothetical protein